MNYLMSAVMMCFVITGCKDMIEEDKDRSVFLNHVFDSSLNGFVEVNGSGIFIFPVTDRKINCSTNRKDKKDYKKFLFYNSRAGECYLLSDTAIFISSYNIIPRAGHDTAAAYILFDAVACAQNLEFVKYLYVSDAAGHNFRRISPDNTYVKSWRYLKSFNKVLILVAADINDDKKFSGKDSLTLYECSLDSVARPHPIITNNLRDSL